MAGKAVVGEVLRAGRKLGLVWRPAELPTTVMTRTAALQSRKVAPPQPHSGVLIGERGGGVDNGDQCELDAAQTRELELEQRLGVVFPGHGARWDTPGRMPLPPRDVGRAKAAPSLLFGRAGDDRASSRTSFRDVRQLETLGSMAVQRPRPFPDVACDREELVLPSHRPSRIILVLQTPNLENPEPETRTPELSTANPDPPHTATTVILPEWFSPKNNNLMAMHNSDLISENV